MIRLTPTSRRSWGVVARTGAAVSATMLVFSVVTALTASALPAGTAATPGQTVTPTSGNSGTSFNITFSGTNACPGDSAAGGYRWNTYMVPAGVDPATLIYNSNGPILPAGATFTFPLFSTANAAQVNKNTAPTTGIIFGAPVFSFAALSFVGGAPTGDYKIGVACTLLGVTERFWMTQITITTNPAGGPAGFDWAVAGSTPPTTLPPTTLPPTTTAAPTTTVPPPTTTVPGSTTTVPGSTTTTLLPPTTTVPGSTTTTLLPPTTTVPGSTTTVPGSTTTVDDSTTTTVDDSTTTTVDDSTSTTDDDPTSTTDDDSTSGTDDSIPASSTTQPTSTSTSTSTTIPSGTTTSSTSTTSTTSTSTTSTSTTTTVLISTTSSSVASSATPSTAPSVGSFGLPTPLPTSGSLPVTGTSPLPIAFWGILLLVFGRMAILLARPLKVIPLEAR